MVTPHSIDKVYRNNRRLNRQIANSVEINANPVGTARWASKGQSKRPESKGLTSSTT